MPKAKETPKKQCENCGAEMERKRYGTTLEDYNTFLRRRFCCMSCANTRHVLTRHGYSWRARKHLKKDCEACGGSVKLHAHHIDQDPSNNDPANIQTLCEICHNFWHATAKRRGWTVAGKMPWIGR